jgi:hypothetical protein
MQLSGGISLQQRRRLAADMRMQLNAGLAQGKLMRTRYRTAEQNPHAGAAQKGGTPIGVLADKFQPGASAENTVAVTVKLNSSAKIKDRTEPTLPNW